MSYRKNYRHTDAIIHLEIRFIASGKDCCCLARRKENLLQFTSGQSGVRLFKHFILITLQSWHQNCSQAHRTLKKCWLLWSCLITLNWACLDHENYSVWFCFSQVSWRTWATWFYDPSDSPPTTSRSTKIQIQDPILLILFRIQITTTDSNLVQLLNYRVTSRGCTR